ncbi:MAG: DUF2341 domain-containing protein, partial [Bacteroidales bacterium]
MDTFKYCQPVNKSDRRRFLFRFLVSILFTILVFSAATSQTTGDYRSVADGNWSNRAIWERFDGTGWATPSGAQGYPGSVAVPGRVDVGNNVTLNIDPTNSIGDLYINSGILELGQYSITFSGSTNIYGTLNDSNGDGTVTFSGPIYIDETGVWNSVSGNSDRLRLFSDIVNNSSNVTLERCRLYSDITISGSGVFVVEDYLEFNVGYTLINQSTITAGFHINYNAQPGAVFINDENSALNYSGNADLMNNGTLIASAEGNTVNYDGDGQNIIVPLDSRYFNLITSGTSTKNLRGSIIVGGDITIGSGTLLDITVNDYSIDLGGDWTNNNAVNGFDERGGSVTLNGSGDQIITHPGGETFYNLQVNKSMGTVRLMDSNAAVANQLTMTSGNINTGDQILIISSTASNSLNYSSGTVIGRMQRGVANTAVNYLFPIGTTDFTRSATLRFNSLGGGVSITTEFVESSPGAFSPYNDDGSLLLNSVFSDGYWRFSSSSTPACSYTLDLTGQGFESFGIDNNTRITGRTAQSTAWQDMGQHGTVSAPTVTRSNLNFLNTTSFDFAFASACDNKVNAGADQYICSDESVQLNASGTGSFTWSPSYGLSATNVSDPVASPAVTTTYRVSAVDGSCTSSDIVTVYVEPEPGAVLGYAYQKIITVNSSAVFGTVDHENFPILVHISSSPDRDELRSVINGGHVENTNGFDIIFTDADYHRLDHQIESYDPVTGDYLAWVRIPLLSRTSDTMIRLLYGNPQVTDNPSTSDVWDASYSGVWHLNSLDDATRNGNNGTNDGASPASGMLGAGYQFGGTDRINIPRSSFLEPDASLSVSLWMRREGNQNSWAKPLWYGLNNEEPWGPYGFEFVDISDNNIRFHITNGSDQANPEVGSVIDSDEWYLLTGTYDGTSARIYLNGDLYSSVPMSGPIGQYGMYGLALGNKSEDIPAQGFTGTLDEVRISTTPRSYGWIKTEYANQSSPATFYSISAESSCSIFEFEPECALQPVTYSVPAIALHTYEWIVSGGTPSSTSGNAITVDWGSEGPWSIQLIETSGSCTGQSLAYSVTITDVEDPIFNCPVAGIQTVTTDAGTCKYTHTGTSWNATGSDNCGVLSIEFQLTGDTEGTGTSLDGAVFNTGTTTVTWTVTDTRLNTSTCSFDVEVTDDEDPAITCPADVTLDCDDDHSPTTAGSATATDNCAATANITISFSDVSTQGADPANADYYNYTITRTWRAEDPSGNFSECDQLITIEDVTVPVITCPTDITLNCDDDHSPTTAGSATATDNCSATANITITYSDVSTQGADPANADYYNYTITRTWHAEDPSGNFSECDQLITIEDVTVPAITCPTDITLNCDDDHSPTTAGSATATDNCAATVNITISYSDVSTQGSDPDNADYYNYTITRTWRAEDPSGNFSECEQLITIEDVTVPTVICNDITVYLDVTSGLLSLTPEMIDGGTFDNCSPVHLSVSRSNFDCTDLGENTVWLYAEDASGNIDSCQAVVNIQYTVVPVPVAVPADTIICNDSY